MNSNPWRLITLLLFTYSGIFAQKLKKADRTIVSNIQTHTTFLTQQRMQGRVAGSEGEKLAGEYIGKQFARSGLKPRGDSNTWFQQFEIDDGKEVLPATYLTINGQKLKLFAEYFPFSFSASKKADAAVAIALAEKGVPWFKDLREILDNVEDSPKADTFEVIRNKANRAAEKGATALIIYNSSDNGDLQYNKYGISAPVTIPVIYIKKDGFKKYCSDESAILDITLNVSTRDKKRKGENIIGYADNNADSTIIASASLGNETNIAALLELARLSKNIKRKKQNYLFIAYCAEQNGNPGMNYFNQHPSLNLQKINYTVNLDTVTIADKNPKGLNLVKRSIELIKTD